MRYVYQCKQVHTSRNIRYKMNSQSGIINNGEHVLIEALCLCYIRMYRKPKTITVYIRKTIYDGIIKRKMNNINVIDYNFCFLLQDGFFFSFGLCAMLLFPSSSSVITRFLFFCRPNPQTSCPYKQLS